MLNCEFCGREFTRKFNLTRHLKTKHSSSNNGNGTKYIIVDEHYNNSIVNDHNKRDNNNVSGISNINDENKHNSKSPPLETNSFIKEFPDGKVDFDERMLAATEAIKQKFNLLRNTSKGIHNSKSVIPTQQKQQEAFVNVVSENNNTTRLEANLLELLQCMLDILMIKELQNVDITEEGKETADGRDKNIKLKRRFSSVDVHGTDSEIGSRPKHSKYDNSIEYNNGNDNTSINSECIVKYWHDPNTLVNELRDLIDATHIGQEISSLIHRLNDKNTSDYDELIRNLNKLKQTSIGQQIFCIINQLEKANIIESIDYANNEMDHLSDDEEHLSDDEESYTTDERITAGKGLYIRPYKTI